MEGDAKLLCDTDGDDEMSGVYVSVGVSRADKETDIGGEIVTREDRDCSSVTEGVPDCEGDEDSLGELDVDRLG